MACDDRPVCISAFYLWILGGGVFILCPGYFSYCHVFPMVSALDYSLLKHVVINDDLLFCQRDMSRQGGSWLF